MPLGGFNMCHLVDLICATWWIVKVDKLRLRLDTGNQSTIYCFDENEEGGRYKFAGLT